ncbi:hypothetical protein GCM10009639_19460 [Kitasatospora putterlickiae]|uniref:Transcriptional regulator n=1 Tax=Kitasatospora putterlickiae TaxID=221725 RepID=A0ABN1XV40_9ACTN
MGRTSTPNHLLRALLDEAQWNGATLAQRAAEVAAEQGITLLFDRKSVSFWLSGRKPRSPAPAIVAEALSRGLGRSVTEAATGLTRDVPTAAPKQEDGTDDAAAALDLLGRAQRRPWTPGVGTYSLTRLEIPGWDQTAGAARVARPPRSEAPVTVEQVAAVEQMARLFSDHERTFGGGQARKPLAAYLAHVVAPLLHCSAPSALRRRLYRVATRLAYLCAFMCFDDNEHALAQHYYRVALRLACEGADPASYAVTLRALSVQARSLGHHGHALRLAETAEATGYRRATPTRHAFLLGQLAVAAAADSDRTAALSALSRAERLMQRATSQVSAELIGGYHLASLAHQQATVRHLLGDTKGAIASLQTSLRHRPAAECRSRAVVTAQLAELQLRSGHLDQAVHSWQSFLDDFPHLRSGRVTAARRTMRAHLRPYAANAGVRHLLARPEAR